MDKKIRYLERSIKEDLTEKMVFLGGPRQVGKTTLALHVLGGDKSHEAYMNWDDVHAKPKIMRGVLPAADKLVVFDEIHKYSRWRGLIKGFFDKRFPEQSFLVTGSARLDYYRKGGDSLLGRYHYYRLHPFSIPELGADMGTKDVEQLLRFGGFPEPFLKGSEVAWRRWQRERLERVINIDLRDLEHVKEISLVELLVEALPARVGSPLSVKNLREELGVAHDTVERWLKILENMYVVFRLPPFGASRIKAVKKEQKLYFWDWSQCIDEGARFENMVACHLLKYCHYHEDTLGHKMELRYIRDIEGREVDFVVLKDKKPLFAVECKTGERNLSRHLYYFSERMDVPVFYQTHAGGADFVPGDSKKLRMIPFSRLCREIHGV
ncbi:MAG: AAA family ATPase [Bdellovibrionales bacterium RIFOXYD1_FULL_53_11]|nr:MAG: AAA family ATPase [Bdellovibrionales bacterium RIFOXYD1_FULL_53_11]